MSNPDDRKYLDSHEWHKVQGNVATIGISRFAIDELTDITFVQLPPVGAQFTAGDAVGEIESVKATSELYTGVSGKVVAVNEAVAADPSIVNKDPYENGWLVKIEMSNRSEVDGLMDAAAYGEKYPGA